MEMASRPLRLLYRGWTAFDHAEVEPTGLVARFSSGVCAFCGLRLLSHFYRPPTSPGMVKKIQDAMQTAVESMPTFERHLYRCPGCGWWQLQLIRPVVDQHGGVELHRWWKLYHALMEEVDISSEELGLADIRRHLASHWEDRRFIGAGTAQRLVADLLRERFGGEVFHTAANVNAPDGGVDLIVAMRGDRIGTAVQVKRRIVRDVEPVSEVRNFVGAMLVGGYSNGVFITTAERFSSQAKAIAASPALARVRLDLTLVHGQQLLELLQASARTRPAATPNIVDPNAAWIGPNGYTASTTELFGSE